MIRQIVRLIPEMFLPNYHKVIADRHGGTREPLAEDETRHRLEETTRHHIDRLLEKYSPLHLLLRSIKNKSHEKARKDFVFMVGEIALFHASLEQQMKTILFQEFRIPRKKAERLYGKRLRDTFSNEAQNKLSSEIVGKIEKWANCFDRLSVKRNEFVKSLYSFDSETGKPFQVNEIDFHQGIIDNWMIPVDFDDLKNIRDNFVKLWGDMIEIRRAILKINIKDLTDTSRRND